MSVETLGLLRHVLVWGAVAVVACLVAFFRLRVPVRGFRIESFARRNGLRWLGKLPALPDSCRDLAALHAVAAPRDLHCIGGVRGGRQFAAFDHHYTLPGHGSEARAHMGMLLLLPVYWIILPLIDRARDPGFTAVVVECDLPPGVRTTDVKKDLRPWIAEFGAKASLIRSDGYCSPAEMLEAADRLNAALDRILADARLPTVRSPTK